MNIILPMAHGQLPPDSGPGSGRFSWGGRKAKKDRGFSLVEVLLAVTLLSLIVLALMAVFNMTQNAFRASVTQTDVLEGGRATMDLITTDLRQMTPSGGVSNYVFAGSSYTYGAVNFFATNNSYQYAPLVQMLPGTSTRQRTNLLQWFFLLGRENTKWTGAGYIVNASSASPLYPLYRFYAETNITANPVVLYWDFLNTINAESPTAPWTNMTHLMDGVLHLVVRAYDPAGYRLTNGYNFTQIKRPQNVWFSPPMWGELGFSFYNSAVPASVELELGALEDRALARAESRGIPNQPPYAVAAQWSYLTNQVGSVHVFRQRVTIPNLDPTAYQ